MTNQMQKTFLVLIVVTLINWSVQIKKAKIKPEWLSWRGCIDFHIVNDLMALKPQALQQPLQLTCSINLGFSVSDVIVNNEGLCLPTALSDGAFNLLATWDELETIQKKKTGCYSLYDDGSKPFHITTLSENTGIPASLYPPLESTGAPTIILGGFTMHRIVGDAMNPYIDTVNKLETVPIFRGARVLDTSCGLGYTAIAAAKRVVGAVSSMRSPSIRSKDSLKQNAKEITAKPNTGQVTTIEYDDASLEMCAHNPWSQGLFDRTLPIEVLQGDSCEIVKQFRDKSFNVVIHDPPARNLCRTDLYSLSFYQQLKRVLTTNGILYHYIGNPSSKESGRLYSGVIARLKQAGFENIKKASRAFGVVASAGMSSYNNPSVHNAFSSSAGDTSISEYLQIFDDKNDALGAIDDLD